MQQFVETKFSGKIWKKTSKNKEILIKRLNNLKKSKKQIEYLCQANLFAGRMEIEVRFDRVSIMAIQKKKVAGRSKSRKTNSAWRYHQKKYDADQYDSCIAGRRTCSECSISAQQKRTVQEAGSRTGSTD